MSLKNSRKEYNAVSRGCQDIRLLTESRMRFRFARSFNTDHSVKGKKYQTNPFGKIGKKALLKRVVIENLRLTVNNVK